MSLKTPLFLALIVGALCLAVFLIWPSFQQISVKKNQLQLAQQSVDSIKEKNTNIGNLIKSLNDEQNLGRKEFVLSYIPLDKKEEVLFNSLSRIANSDGVGVALSGLSLDVQKEEAPKAVVAEAPQSSQEALLGGGVGPDGIVPTAASVLPVERTIRATTLVVGKYENVKKFIEKIYTLDMLKNIFSVTLTSVKSESGAATDNVLANITANFSFFPEAKINNDYNSPIFGKKSFNFAVVDEIKALLSQKAEFVTVETVGRSNPFLP